MEDKTVDETGLNAGGGLRVRCGRLNGSAELERRCALTHRVVRARSGQPGRRAWRHVSGRALTRTRPARCCSDAAGESPGTQSSPVYCGPLAGWRVTIAGRCATAGSLGEAVLDWPCEPADRYKHISRRPARQQFQADPNRRRAPRIRHFHGDDRHPKSCSSAHRTRGSAITPRPPGRMNLEHGPGPTRHADNPGPARNAAIMNGWPPAGPRPGQSS